MAAPPDEPAEPAEPDEPPPPEIPGYVIERLLAVGAFGRVYLARSRDALGAPSAIKYFPPHGPRWSFERELETFRAVKAARDQRACPQVMEGYEADTLPGGGAYIVMAYCEGGSLRDRVEERGALAEDTAIGYLEETLRAIAFLHAVDICHKDVKPSNLLLTAAGELRVTDFGLARPSDHTLTGHRTPAFAPPQHALAEGGFDGKSLDLYACGLTLFNFVTGHPPAVGEPLMEGLVRARVSVPVQDVVLRATHRDAKRRYADAEAFLAGLAEARERLRAPAPSHGRRAARPGDAPRALTGRARIGAALGFLALALVAGFALTPHNPEVVASPRGTWTVEPDGLRLHSRSGEERFDPLDEAGAITSEGATIVARPFGGYLAVVAQFTDGRVNRAYVFDLERGARAAGWERPFDLSVGGDAPAAWGDRLDLFDVSAKAMRLWDPRLVDLDGDGQPELLLKAGNPRGLAGTTLFAVDVATRQVLGAYTQFGFFTVLSLHDVDGDDVPDIFLAGPNNYVDFEGLPMIHNPACVAVLRGKALLEPGRRSVGPPGLPDASGAPPDAFPDLLAYAALPFCRVGPHLLDQIVAEVRWEPTRQAFHIHASAAPLEWLEQERRLRNMDPLDTSSWRLGTFYSLDGNGAPTEPPVTVNMEGAVLPLLPLVVDGRPTRLAREATLGAQYGADILRVTVPTALWSPPRPDEAEAGR